MEQRDIRPYLKPGVRAHLMGVGGVSMAPLAHVLLGRGLLVSGSDMQNSPAVEELRALGVNVHIGHAPENVNGAELVIRTAAVHDDNPEIVAARAAGVPVFERAQAWGALMEGYEKALCVAGTHGKTTTTSMCTLIALAQGADPTVMIGGTLPALGRGWRVGHGGAMVMEACEYCDSFLSFFPTVAVILNIEADHLDYFTEGLPQIQRSFRTFAELTPETGAVVANAEDENTMAALAGIDRRVLTFGLERGDVTATDLTWHKGLPSFNARYRGNVFCHIDLAVPGLHNVKNALAATAAAIAMGWSADAVSQGLAAFTGAGRRFEKLGEVNGAAVYDDYAHHPGELRALLTAVRPLGYERVVCAFQPHTYTRTKSLFDDFVEVLKLADLAVLTDIYAARETDTLGVSSAQLSAAIPGSLYCPSLDDLAAKLRELARPGDLILLVGAGDIVNVGKTLCG